jgi:hypothetical protein
VEERDADLAPTSPGADEESTSSSLAAEEAASPIEGAAPSDSPPPQAGAEREAALPADAKDDLSTAPEVEGDAASVGTALLAAQTQEEEVLPLKAMEVVLGVLLVLLALVTLFATWRLRQRGRPA